MNLTLGKDQFSSTLSNFWGRGPGQIVLLFSFFLLAFLILPSFSSAFTLTKVPIGGVDTSDGSFTLNNVVSVNGVFDRYTPPAGAYKEALYQEYMFDYQLCDSAVISSVVITINWQVKNVAEAKLDVYDHTGAHLNYPLSHGTNNQVTDTVTVTNITTPADVNALRIRFLAHDGSNPGPGIDFVQVAVTYSDPNVCISPDGFTYQKPGRTASFSHLVSYTPAIPAPTINLNAAPKNGWATRIYLDANMDGVKDDNTPINQVTVNSNGYAGIVVETDVPSGYNGSDVATVTATRSSPYSSHSVTDTTATPADGAKEAEYSAPYATRKFFDYGPDPNRASGEILTYVKDGLLYIYYAQNPRNINDNSYGTWAQNGWGAGGHTLNPDLALSDKTEFIFYDENGNIKLNFFSDYVTVVTATADFPGGYHSCGFLSPCSGGATSDGSMLINNTVLSNVDLAKYISIESSAAYNINRYTPTVGGQTIVNCGSYGNVDLKLNSPPINRTTYELFCPAASDFIFDYAIEVVIPIAKIFPNEPIVNIVARAHNSPNKNRDRDNPPTPAVASIGDYVWYDLNGNGVQEEWEIGIPNVRVVLYWDKNGDGLFSESEKLLESRTDGNGYYLFQGIYGGQFYSITEGVSIDDGQYKVWVDETSIPPGFIRSDFTPNPYVLSNSITGAIRESLAYDENCRTADFGYKPNGGVIGDFVWFDANNNGIQDNGELGIANVTLKLTNVNTSQEFNTKTNSQGRYFFTGLVAGTYRVDVTDTSGVLNGYTHTIGPESHPDPTGDINLENNGVNLLVDFGYYKDSTCSTGDIAGKVFLDANWSRGFDSGDTGLSGVDLSVWRDSNNNGLLDVTDEFIGSTTTNTSGDYHFYGLPVSSSGITYVVQVTSPLSGLDKFYPSGGLFATLTSAACGATLNFPYVATGAIGDFVWNDLNNNGIQDAGEPGIEGVTIQAQYCDPSTPPPGCSNTFTYNTTTDAQGHYMFSGLRTTDTGGSRYKIIVTDTNHVLTGWDPSPRTCTDPCPTIPNDSNNPTGTDVTLGGSPTSPKSDFTIDFGYHNINLTFGSIGDYIWNDDNGDGGQDEDKAVYGINDVTLELRNQFDETIATTTTTTKTDSNGTTKGYYLFTGLPVNASYRVVVTDLNGVLSGYTMTTDSSVLQVILTTSIPVLTADAGYRKIPTFAFISSFEAYPDGSRAVVKWETSLELNTVGFYLLRLNERTGRYEQVTTSLIPALIGSPQGGFYRVLDEGAVPGNRYSYKIVEIESRGGRREYGPFEVTVKPSADPSLGSMVSSMSRTPHEISSAAKARAQAAKKTVEDKKAHDKGKKGTRIRVSVTEDGLYFLSASEISALLGKSLSEVTDLVRKNTLSLTYRGQGVAYVPAKDGSGLFFYGQGIESIYTKKNVYWLTQEKGLLMNSVKGDGPKKPGAGDETFPFVLHLEEDRVAAPALFADPEADIWSWDYIFGGFPDMDTKTFTFDAKGVAKTNSTASLTVYLQGASVSGADHDHHVVVSLNDTVIGEGQWKGNDRYTLTLPFNQNLLNEEDNTIKVQGLLDTGAGIFFSFFLIDSFDLDYDRLYEAENNALLCTGNGHPVVSITGFTNQDISVFDMTDPLKPKYVLAVTIDGTAGNYRVSFVPTSPETLYLAVSSSAARPVADLSADTPSDLSNKGNRADYIVLTASELKDTAQSLAAYRKGQGLETMVVTLEDVMDEFNDGILDPKAIKSFLSYAYTHWKKAPKYVVLAGKGTYDYKDNLGQGGNFVPPMMRSTPFGLFASDSYFADVDGDSGPEMAIGRLSAVTVEELQTLIQKIIAYESAGTGLWKKNILMVADNPDEGGDFPADSDSLVPFVPSGYSVEKIYLPLADAQNSLVEAINDGVLLMNYMGHSATDGLNHDLLVCKSGACNLDALTNGVKLPVVTAMTCFMNDFADPFNDVLGEMLVMKNSGGAIAVWGPTGMSLNAEAVLLGKKFFQALFGDRKNVLGEAIRQALQEAREDGIQRFMLEIYNLIGDPALRVW
jgi:hypothetical protein